MIPGSPPELVVYDEAGPCPYLEGRVARMPLRLPVRELSREELDQRLSAGDRRQGPVLYRTACPDCRACEPIRLEVGEFAPSRSQQRAKIRGDRELTTTLGPPLCDEQRVALYNRHKQGRGLGDRSSPIDADGYREFLVQSCCETFELAYRAQGQLVGVAIVDRGAESLSAVYCHFDPARRTLGIGTYSILAQIELCRSWGLRWLYLGLYIGDSSHMRYKAGFLPHQRLIDGQWARFDR